MAGLTTLEGVAAPLLRANISTDLIAPAYRPATAGVPPAQRPADPPGKNLFANLRYDDRDNELPDFILNREPFRQARFLITGPNFGAGSSRETAVTYLVAWGIRSVIAPGFGPIWYDNAFKNGLCPILLDTDRVHALATLAETGASFALDVEAGTLTIPGEVIRFDIPPFRRELLTSGADEIAVSLRRTPEIDAWQAAARKELPWLFPKGGIHP